MAIISCPECGKEVSDKAKACIHCGYPLAEVMIDVIEEEVEPFPELPYDLTIGKQIVNWGGDACAKGQFHKSINDIYNWPSGDYQIMLHKAGINITLSYYSILEISFSQIIEITELSGQELRNKSLEEREAIVGGKLMGALVSQTNDNVFYLLIKYWDVNSRTKVILSFVSKQSFLSFINRFNKEKNLKAFSK